MVDTIEEIEGFVDNLNSQREDDYDTVPGGERYIKLDSIKEKRKQLKKDLKKAKGHKIVSAYFIDGEELAALYHRQDNAGIVDSGLVDEQHMTYVARSTIPNAGEGLFANTNIPKGYDFEPYIGQVMSKEEVDKKYPGNNTFAEYVIDIQDSRLFIDGVDEWTYLARFANTSLGGRPKNNAKFVETRGDVNFPFLRATRDIMKGDEIIADYGDNYWDKAESYPYIPYTDTIKNRKQADRAVAIYKQKHPKYNETFDMDHNKANSGALTGDFGVWRRNPEKYELNGYDFNTQRIYEVYAKEMATKDALN